MKVVLVDPGLREVSGHHPAAVESVLNSIGFKQNLFELDIFSHRDFNESLLPSLTNNKKVRLQKHFETDFYKYFYQDTTIPKLQHYIFLLANEYRRVLENYQDDVGKDMIFWLHTLSWEHAYSLALAIQKFNLDRVVKFRYLVGIMYSPTRYTKTGKLNIHHKLNYELSYRILNRQKGISFFAAEFELADIYSAMLDKQVLIHPCLLTSNCESVSKERNKILVYAGDAKEYKGFLDLPDIIMMLLTNDLSNSCEFIIQYTLTNESPDLVNAEKKLLELAIANSNLTIISRFLMHNDFIALICSCKSILFNYNDRIYSNQSSGLLWIAAFSNLKIVSLNDGWLLREAKRLGCDHSLVNKNTMVQELTTSKQSIKKYHPNGYFKQVFSDIGLWLSRQGSDK